MIQAITEASQSVSYSEMARLQNQLAEAILKDPDVVNLSSLVGVDGTNETLNSGRFLISLTPHDNRTLDCQPDHQTDSKRGSRCYRHHALHAAGAGPDHRLYGQPRSI